MIKEKKTNLRDSIKILKHKKKRLLELIKTTQTLIDDTPQMKKKKLLSIIEPNCRKEYEHWLYKFLDQGGDLTHYYDYSLLGVDWCKTNTNKIPYHPWCGAQSVNIVFVNCIPSEWGGEETGHCNFYWLNEDGIAKTNSGWVPFYDNLCKKIGWREYINLFIKKENLQSELFWMEGG